MTTRTKPSPAATRAQVRKILAWLERRGSRRNREGMARYAITAPKVFGVSMGTMQPFAKRLGRSHELAAALWKTGWYEARILTAFVDEPARVTPAQTGRWARHFDNWAICDTVCFKLFDRTPHAWSKINQWSRRDGEFVTRAAFALLADPSSRWVGKDALTELTGPLVRKRLAAASRSLSSPRGSGR